MRRVQDPTPSARRVGSVLALFVFAAAMAPPPTCAVQAWPITRHDIQATVEPVRSHLAVVDVLEFGATPDRAQPLALLLHQGLVVDTIELDGKKLVFAASTGFQPRHFWQKPDYERLKD